MLAGQQSALFGGLATGNDAFTKSLMHFNDFSMMDAAKGLSQPRVWTPYNVTMNTNVKKFGTSSAFFPGGAVSYIIVKNSADFDFGAGNFTVDWWEYRTSGADGQSAFRRQLDNTVQGFLFGHYSAGTLTCYMSSATANGWDIANGQSMGAITLNQWVHFAVVRSGNVFSIYKNGVTTATWVSGLALMAGAGDLTIGHWNGNGFPGYMDEIRFSKGIARWTAPFNPPAKAYGPDPDYSAWHTVGLYHMNNITNVGGTAFVESSLYAKPPTSATGYGHPYNAFASGPQGSCYFNAANLYLAIQHSEDFNFGSGDFTVDWWDWRSDAVGGRPGMVRRTQWVTYQPFLLGWHEGNNLVCYGSSNATSWDVLSSLSMGPVTVNVWSHRAITRKNGVFYGFKDGVLQASSAASAGPFYLTTDPMFIGVWNYEVTGPTQFWGNGLIDEVRISKGVARWTSNFPVPTVPYS